MHTNVQNQTDMFMTGRSSVRGSREYPFYPKEDTTTGQMLVVKTGEDR